MTSVPPSSHEPQPAGQPYPGAYPAPGQPGGAYPGGGYPGPSYPGPGQDPQERAARTTRTLSIVGLVTAIIPCTAVIGLVASIVALVRGRRTPGSTRTMAVVGVVIGALWIIGGILLVVFGIGTLIQTCADLGPGVHYVDGVTYTCDY